MLKKMLGKKRSSSASSSSSEPSETSEERKGKKSSISTNLKTMLNGSPKDKKSSVTTTKVRSRRSSSSEGSSRRASLPHVGNSSSNISLHTVDLTGSPIRSRSRSSSLLSSGPHQPFSAGELRLQVHSAKKLEKKGMFGKADPYVFVTFGAKKIKSKTVNNNQNPEWDFDILLPVDNPSLAGHVLIEIFDDDLGKDDLL